MGYSFNRPDAGLGGWAALMAVKGDGTNVGDMPRGGGQRCGKSVLDMVAVGPPEREPGQSGCQQQEAADD
ncbi:hypothetical protein ASD13_05225 [Microbacterium sp. Root1433D1]|nr:hypothetical protein ASD13_05225 [Microbacterium sp. Root1433D1]